MFRIQSPPIDNILARCVPIHPESFTDLFDPLRPECTLGINICNFPFGSAVLFRELADYGGSHAKLRFSGAELTEYLRDRHGLDATAEHCIEVFAAGRDTAHLPADVAELGGGDEVVGCGLSRSVILVGTPEKTTEKRERTAHFVAASLTFSVFCSEKPKQAVGS